MKNKVCILILYFGKFPNSIKVFLYSCEQNPEFRWIIFTDDKLDEVPSNVEVIYCVLEDIRELIEKKVGFAVSLDKPYKLCDFRPAFGHIFEDYLKGCDFWGYGDIDLVYGNLSAFIKDELLDYYDKIYPCGHLSLVRNNYQINHIYTQDTSNSSNYKEVFTDKNSYIFDEYHGFNEKLITNGKKIYGQIDFADIDVIYKRFRTADKRTISVIFPQYLFKKSIPMNYRYQIFGYEDGKAYRIYKSPNEIVRNELAYIHYRYKIPCDIDVNDKINCYICSEGFINKVDTVTLDVIKRWNNYPGFVAEQREYILFLGEQMIYKLGRLKKVRNFIRFLKGKKKL